MLFLILGVNQDVVDEHYHKLIQIHYKNHVHQIHEVDKNICQLK
jgi:hypothetical protein